MIKANKQRNRRLLFWVALIVLSLPFYFIYFNNTIPFTDGWGIYYVELIKKGLVPYKDFYYYLPPLNLGIDYAFWSFSAGYIIIYRMFRLLERLFMISMIYWLLSKYFKPQYVLIGTYAGAILGTAVVYDLMGDYNQTSELFIVFLCWLVIKYVESNTQKERYLSLFFVGFVIALTFLLKQSSGLAAGIIYSITFCVYSWIQMNQNFIKEIISVIAGIFIPLLVCVLYLCLNDAFVPFIEQVFLNGSNSKGGLFNIIIVSIVSQFKNYPELILFLFMVLFVNLYIIADNKKMQLNQNQIMMVICLFLLPILSCFVFYKEEIYALYIFVKDYWKIIFIVGALTIFTFFMTKFFIKKKCQYGIEYTIFFSGVIICSYVLIYTNQTLFWEQLNNTGLFSLISKIGIILLFCLLFSWIYFFYKIRQNSNKQNIIYLMLLSSALTSTYAAAMASGSSIPAVRPMFLSIPIVLSIGLEYGHQNSKVYHFKNIAISFTAVVLCIITFSQKYTCSYSWWGWSEDNFSQKDQQIDVHGLEGFRVSKKQKDIYEKVIKLIEENSEEDDLIYGFPHMKIFNILTDNIKDPGFIPVPFYDVCGDSYAVEEAVNLKNNSPDIVVWCDIPGCLETHEEVFRNGNELGQRKIVEWFKHSVNNKQYILIGQVDNIFVYKKKERSESYNKYFDDITRKNITLEEFE